VAKIREAVPDEVERVLGMYEWLFAPPGSVPPQWDAEHARVAIADTIADPSSTILIAEHRGRLLGFLTAYLDVNSVRYGQRCWIEDLAVSPEDRSQGVGGDLLDAAASWARERGATHFELVTALFRTDAQRFYERRNPVATGHSYSWLL
jgi:GNAT superfamily N-acetyltransferase